MNKTKNIVITFIHYAYCFHRGKPSHQGKEYPELKPSTQRSQSFTTDEYSDEKKILTVTMFK